MLLSRKVYIGVGIILVAAVSAVLAVPLMQKAEQGVINPPAEVAKPVEATEAEQNLALFFGQDDRIFISAPYAAPFNAIGKLETEAASQCTATLVAPNLAVTAAHCFFMEPHKFDKGRWFWAGYHQGKWQARYQVTGQVFHSRFRKGLDYVGEGVYIKPAVAGYDIAWLKLKWTLTFATTIK